MTGLGADSFVDVLGELWLWMGVKGGFESGLLFGSAVEFAVGLGLETFFMFVFVWVH